MYVWDCLLHLAVTSECITVREVVVYYSIVKRSIHMHEQLRPVKHGKRAQLVEMEGSKFTKTPYRGRIPPEVGRTILPKGKMGSGAKTLRWRGSVRIAGRLENLALSAAMATFHLSSREGISLESVHKLFLFLRSLEKKRRGEIPRCCCSVKVDALS